MALLLDCSCGCRVRDSISSTIHRFIVSKYRFCLADRIAFRRAVWRTIRSNTISPPAEASMNPPPLCAFAACTAVAVRITCNASLWVFPIHGRKGRTQMVLSLQHSRTQTRTNTHAHARTHIHTDHIGIWLQRVPDLIVKGRLIVAANKTYRDTAASKSVPCAPYSRTVT